MNAAYAEGMYIYFFKFIYKVVYIYSFILIQAFDAMNLKEIDGDDHQQQQRAFQDLERENRELRQTVQDLQKTLRQREVISSFPLLLFLLNIYSYYYHTSNFFKICYPIFSGGIEGLKQSMSR